MIFSVLMVPNMPQIIKTIILFVILRLRKALEWLKKIHDPRKYGAGLHGKCFGYRNLCLSCCHNLKASYVSKSSFTKMSPCWILLSKFHFVTFGPIRKVKLVLEAKCVSNPNLSKIFDNFSEFSFSNRVQIIFLLLKLNWPNENCLGKLSDK